MSSLDLLNTLWSEIEAGRIRVDLVNQGEGFAHLLIRSSDFGFHAMAYPKPINQGE